MRVILAAPLWAALLLVAAALPAWAQSPLVAELRVWATRYHEHPQKIDEIRAALEQAAQTHADLGTLLALSQAPAYALGGNIYYYEVPGFVGGDLDRSEAMFRRGLKLDPHYTNMRVGLARTLSKKGRTADARREALAVLDEKAPSNLADWTVKDVTQAKALLEQIKGRS
jgi:hypothetical protein